MSEKNPGAKLFGSAVTARDDNPDILSEARQLASLITDTPSLAPHPFWEVADSPDLAANWNKSFPFQLLLLRKEGGQYSLNSIKHRLTLPIPPQELSINTPFASTTSVTVGGIFTEHNGAPLRQITLSGTTGFTPLRQNVISPGGTRQSGLAGIFAGTISAFKNTTNQVAQLIDGAPLEGPNIISEDEAEDFAFARGTGFYQFLLLKRFLEGYAELKRTTAGKDYRLGLAIWKEDEVYLVEPQNFDLRRSASSPMEYMYSMNLLSWRRLALRDTAPAENMLDLGSDLTRITNTLVRARRVLLGAKNILGAVRNDLDRAIITPLRQTVLLLKDSIGLGLTVLDFPIELANDFKGPVLESITTIKSSARAGFTSSSMVAVMNQLLDMSVEQGKAISGVGQSSDALSAGSDRPGDKNKKAAAPPNKIFDDPESLPELFESIRPGELNLKPATILKMENERRKVANLIQTDFSNFRDMAVSVLADFEQAVGVGDTQYDDTFAPPERSSFKEVTDQDWDIIFALNETIASYDALITETTNFSDTPRDSMEYVAGLASAAGIAFKVPLSKYSVPFPYGYTLEKLSQQYLGTPGRWHEIAALNGLRSPYVDEEGFSRTLSVNGTGRTVTVSDGTNLFVGQPIWISSSNVRREKRRIQRVDVLSATQILLTLDGDDDLDRFTTSASAFIQAFLPDTVNSQQTIFLPSDADAQEDSFRIKNVPGIDYFDPMVRTGGIDLLLDANNDLVVAPNGDARLAVGLTNIVQKVKIALATPLGSVLYHPEYGLPIRVGIASSEFTAQDLLVAVKGMFKGDPTFSGVESASVLKQGNSVFVRVAVGVAGTGQVIPISVQFK